MTLPIEAIKESYIIAIGRYILGVPTKELARVAGVTVGRIYQITGEFDPSTLDIDVDDAIKLYEDWEQVNSENNSVL